MTNLILASGIENLSVTISILVILSMAATFSLLFVLYCRNKKRLILLGDEDEKLKKEILDGFLKYKMKTPEGNLNQYIERKNRMDRIYKMTMDVLCGVVSVFLLAVAITGIVFRSLGKQFFIGNTTYMTIETGSMSFKNTANQYYESLPDNQIEQYAFIGIKKVKEEDIKQFDVVAFKSDGVIYVHRVIQIAEVDGKILYTMQGDANSGSFAFESGIPFENILGRYNGYHNVALGVFLTYMQSEIGIISILFAMALILVMDFSSTYLLKSYNKRKALVEEELNESYV